MVFHFFLKALARVIHYPNLFYGYMQQYFQYFLIIYRGGQHFRIYRLSTILSLCLSNLHTELNEHSMTVFAQLQETT